MACQLAWLIQDTKGTLVISWYVRPKGEGAGRKKRRRKEKKTLWFRFLFITFEVFSPLFQFHPMFRILLNEFWGNQSVLSAVVMPFRTEHLIRFYAGLSIYECPILVLKRPLIGDITDSKTLCWLARDYLEQCKVIFGMQPWYISMVTQFCLMLDAWCLKSEDPKAYQHVSGKLADHRSNSYALVPQGSSLPVLLGWHATMTIFWFKFKSKCGPTQVQKSPRFPRRSPWKAAGFFFLWILGSYVEGCAAHSRLHIVAGQDIGSVQTIFFPKSGIEFLTMFLMRTLCSGCGLKFVQIK